MTTRNLEQLDLNLIRPLNALLESGSVTQAAASLGMTQPGMSKALNRLRQHLGDPLLVRVRGGMELTEQARALRSGVRDSLNTLNDLFAVRGEFEPKTLERTYFVGAPDYAEALVVPRLLERLQEHAPHVDLRIVPLSAAARGRLEDGDLDCLLSLPADEDGALKVRRLFKEDFCCVVREGHPLVGDTLSLDQYCELSHLLIMVSPDGPASGPVDETLGEMGKVRRIALTVHGFLAVAPILARTDLIATLPRRTATLAAQLCGLKLLPPPLELKGFELCLLWHPRRHSDIDHTWLRNQIVKVCQSI